MLSTKAIKIAFIASFVLLHLYTVSHFWEETRFSSCRLTPTPVYEPGTFGAHRAQRAFRSKKLQTNRESLFNKSELPKLSFTAFWLNTDGPTIEAGINLKESNYSELSRYLASTKVLWRSVSYNTADQDSRLFCSRYAKNRRQELSCIHIQELNWTRFLHLIK